MQCCGGGEYCCDPIGLCMECVDGECVDICNDANCEVCDGSGNCVSTCDATECCSFGTCVDKCDPDGGDTCTWTSPPVQDPLCTWMHETDHSCLNPGATCNWEPMSEPGKNATCAGCAPGCTVSTYCVMLKPVVCKTTLTIWPPFIACTCTGTPALYEPVERGTRYICP